MRLWALALTITSVAMIVPPSAVAEARLDPVAALRRQLASGNGVEARLDPVAALRRQLASGNGVTFSNVLVSTSWDGEPLTFRRLISKS
ncbi:hypothetical protein ACIBI9_06910 [Nonomuraea sp. NPDC050451]|uniref:hypothetical protein n=1 Tax=Nonomuraea sp. NPDC050451 TaxID=3364364 RepID=UPI0037991116